MKLLFSVLHATRGRPEKANATMKLWSQRAIAPHAVQYILCHDADDETKLGLGIGTGFGNFRSVEFNGTGSAPAWDYAAKASLAEILIQAQDDVFPPEGWDSLLEEAIKREWWALDRDKTPFVIAVSDGYRKDDLLCTAICNRKRYEQEGHFMFPGYISVFSDDDFSLRAYADADSGRCKLIKAREIVFKHEHPYHTGGPQDEGYRRQNSPKAYEVGQRLLISRNLGAMLKWRTWI
jgi:hypothetical protein